MKCDNPCRSLGTDLDTARARWCLPGVLFEGLLPSPILVRLRASVSLQQEENVMWLC